MQHFAQGHVNRGGRSPTRVPEQQARHETLLPINLWVTFMCHLKRNAARAHVTVEADLTTVWHFCSQTWVWVCGGILAPQKSRERLASRTNLLSSLTRFFLNMHDSKWAVTVLRWTSLCAIRLYSDDRCNDLMHLKFRAASRCRLWSFIVYSWFNWSFLETLLDWSLEIWDPWVILCT